MKRIALGLFSLSLFALVPALEAQDLPEGKGKDITEQVCGSCHGTDVVAARRATKSGWTYIVDDMVSRGASATAEQVAAINDYLTKNFGQVNVNKGAAAELASILDIAPDKAEAIVKYRTANGDFKDLDGLKKVPGIGASLDSKKDRITYN